MNTERKLAVGAAGEKRNKKRNRRENRSAATGLVDAWNKGLSAAIRDAVPVCRHGPVQLPTKILPAQINQIQ